MTKQHARDILNSLRATYKATDNTTILDCLRFAEDLNDEMPLDKIYALRDNFANLTWDTTIFEAQEIIESEPD